MLSKSAVEILEFLDLPEKDNHPRLFFNGNYWAFGSGGDKVPRNAVIDSLRKRGYIGPVEDEKHLGIQGPGKIALQRHGEKMLYNLGEY